MNKTQWKALYKKMGMKNTIGFILSIILTIIGMIMCFEEFGFKFVFLTFAFSYLYDNLKNLISAISKTIKEYSIKK